LFNAGRQAPKENGEENGVGPKLVCGRFLLEAGVLGRKAKFVAAGTGTLKLGGWKLLLSAGQPTPKEEVEPAGIGATELSCWKP